ncbi:AP-5 complex subunit beta-1-like [Thalassophryne amazonica]|uniref:AP-5 complex subunit beta-1-like n=1 Tax=Thalassophryne amazonica TaxID=390379 RepID=UPI00147174D7|nr:AP-5 complex subunit beta-1-like [Thalassophryne amazonica]
MEVKWSERVSAFLRSPSDFLCETQPEVFLSELLRELRDDRASNSVKVLLLSPLCEYPALLCPSDSVAEETALELMSVFAQCPPKATQFRCHLQLALTTVLICTSCVNNFSRAAQDFLEMLLQIVQDTSDLHGDGALRAVRATACDCLRELEACCPGLLAQRLELLSGLRQQEISRLHQAYTGLQTLVLRNTVYLLTQENGAGTEHLKALLGGNSLFAWEAEHDLGLMNNKDSALLSSIVVSPMGTVPVLNTGPDCKELRSVLSSLLEESYLLTPLCQAALLHRLIEVVVMVPAVPPAIFRTQLLRLLGTTEVCLFHVILMMKSAFTDSLFSAEEEAFILKRLVMLSQHALLSSPEKLFYMHCILHFPENRPIDFSDGDETLPVLLTPQLAAVLAPTVFSDHATMLARFNLLSLVSLEEGEEEGRGLVYLYEHLTSLLHIVEKRGSWEMVVTFFRSVFIFLLHFGHMGSYCHSLTQKLCRLYLGQPLLAPHLINLSDQVQDKICESSWAVDLLKGLQRTITEAPLTHVTLQDLNWHLKVLGRVATEVEIPQHTTLRFLSGIITPSSSSLCVNGDWHLGNGMLGVCRKLLIHPSLDSIFIPLADILQHLTCHYGDIDIQDHSRLYYTLLTTLSPEKLAEVLAQGAVEGQLVKKRTLSAIVAESDGLSSALTVQQTDRPVFKLVEWHISKPKPDKDDDLEGKLDTGTKINETAISAGETNASTALEAYRAQFENPDFASEINLDYQLIHAKVHDPGFDQVFSIRLHFSLKNSHFKELNDITVPCLFRESAPPMVTLRLTPKQPFPNILHVSAIFTSQDGLSWHTNLPDVHVAFHQIFMPLPAPPAWGQRDKLSLFEELWEEICSSGEREDPSDCTTSLFCWQLKNASPSVLVEKHFTPYLLSDTTEGEYKVLLFLPPHSHVLLKIRSEEEAVHFHIATDNWQLLPYISSFLLMSTSSLQDVKS